MQLNDTTNGGLYQVIDDLVGSTSTSDADKLLWCNIYYDRVVGFVLQKMKGWDFSGQIATADLVADQKNYAFPTDLMTIERVEFMIDGSNYEHAENVDERSISKNIDHWETYATASKPFYYFRNNNFWVLPTPDKNVTNGIKIFYTKLVTQFSNDSDEPTFNRMYHIVIAYGTAYELAKNAGMKERANELKNDFNEWLKEMIDYYNTRNKDNQPRARIQRFKQSFK